MEPLERLVGDRIAKGVDGIENVLSRGSTHCSASGRRMSIPSIARGGMPWKECHVMDERLRLVARLLEGERMAPLCAEFGICGRPASYFDDETCRLEPIDNPFGPKVLPTPE